MKIDTKDIRLDTADLDHAPPEKMREALIWLAEQHTVLQKAVDEAGLVRELDDETSESAPPPRCHQSPPVWSLARRATPRQP